MPALGSALIVLASMAQAGPSAPRAVAGFRLQDPRGDWHALDDVRDRRLVVLAFLGVECPVAAQYAPRLAELARSLGPKGVALFAVDANRQDGAAAMGRFARANDLPFPFLKDAGNELADRLGVDRTPEVVVLDAGRAIRYRGRIDDQFAPGLEGPDASGFYRTTVTVAPGRYKYKYVHDRQKYRHDPANWRQTGFFNDGELIVGRP